MLKNIVVPDIGSYSNVPVIEVLVSPGDSIQKEASLITLETEKATMEVPSPYAGVIKSIQVKVGDKVSEGSIILSIETAEGAEGSELKEKPTASVEAPTKAQTQTQTQTTQTSASTPSKTPTSTTTPATQTPASKPAPAPAATSSTPVTATAGTSDALVHASPGVRRFAREFGVDLTRVVGTGPKDRILKTDIQHYIKHELARTQFGAQAPAVGAGGGLGLDLPPWPQLDFTKFGEVAKIPLSRIKKLSGSFLHRNWVMVPHITQFDEADITNLEQFRKENQPIAEKHQIKLTLLPFVMKAVATTLAAFPSFNASLDVQNGELIIKKYIHIGVAVDTPNGLVVPVIRNVDQKGLFVLAQELAEISGRARAGQLSGAEMQGNSFSISSLGGVGGTAFTPIINVPDVAILGVSRAQIKPVYVGANQSGASEFIPRLILPLSLSYDHRVIDGAEGARFTSFLASQLSDIRQLLL